MVGCQSKIMTKNVVISLCLVVKADFESTIDYEDDIDL